MAYETEPTVEPGDTGWELLDWNSAVERPMAVSGFRLVVEGVSPVPMHVEFHDLPIGIVPEEYRGVQVRGRRDEFGPQVETPWRIDRDTAEIPRGRVGYALIGDTKREYFPPKDDHWS